MKYWFLVFTIIILSGCASNPAPLLETEVNGSQADSAIKESVSSKPTVKLPDLGEAPELTNEVWLNVDHPLRLADLRGQVVLIDMWTFG